MIDKALGFFYNKFIYLVYVFAVVVVCAGIYSVITTIKHNELCRADGYDYAKVFITTQMDIEVYCIDNKEEEMYPYAGD